MINRNRSLLSLLAVGILHSPAAQSAQYELEKVWELAPDSRPYLTSSGHNQRGMAYNPHTGHLLIVDRSLVSTFGVIVYIIDAETQEELGEMDRSAVTGGGNSNFPMNLIGVAEDGAVYAANLSNSTSDPHVNIYRWMHEADWQELVFSGDPGLGNIQRWGDTMDVRGGGTATQLLLGSRGNIAAILSPGPANGSMLASQPVSIDSLPGSFGYGVAFGDDNTIWGTAGANTGGPLYVYERGGEPATAETIQSYNSPVVPGGLTVFDIDPERDIMVGLEIGTPDRVLLYNVADLQSAPVLQDAEIWPTDNANNLFAGSVQIGGDHVYILNNNNGIVAYKINSVTPTLPEILLHPVDVATSTGTEARFDVAVKGATPMTYQWYRDGQVIGGATRSSLVIPDVQSGTTGAYTVTVTNDEGSATSDAAQLTLTDPPPESPLRPLWTIPAGTRPYITTSGSSQRGVAYNPVTDHILIPNRAGGISIPILDAETGEEVGVMNSTDISGGSVALGTMAVADDGAIFGFNLTTTANGSLFKIMRWEDESADWTTAFTDISGIAGQRWGDAADVRGSGAATQIIMGAGTGGSNVGDGTTLALFTTEDGENFAVTELVSDAPPFSFSHGITFGEGNTFFGTALNGPLYHMSFDPAAGTATTIKVYEAPFPAEATALDFNENDNLLGAITVAAPDQFFLYDISDLDAGPAQIADASFPTDAANSTGTGTVNFGRDKVIVYDTNNGLMAFRIALGGEEAPALTARLVDGTLVISWPGNVEGFSLQMSEDLGPNAEWSPVQVTPENVGEEWQVSLDNSGAAGFFRLAK